MVKCFGRITMCCRMHMWKIVWHCLVYTYIDNRVAILLKAHSLLVVIGVVSGAPPSLPPAATFIGSGALTGCSVICCHIVWDLIGCTVVSGPVTFPAQWKEVNTCCLQITDIIQTLINCTSLIKAYPCDIPVWEHPLLGQLEHLPCASFQRRNSKVRDRRNGSLPFLSMSPKIQWNLRIWREPGNLTGCKHIQTIPNSLTVCCTFISQMVASWLLVERTHYRVGNYPT